ncbi:MAG TPA: 50S ribosomal protein L39e [Nitrososphaerales archaeon]|nr:50S ribosomal protein L39e [Nitrososphaerales archaeon]
MSKKSSGVKRRLMKMRRQAYPVPTWAIAKTKQKVRTHPQQRQWRRQKLKVK